LTLVYDIKPAILIAIIITIIFSAIVYFRNKRRAKKEYKGRGVL
jgi:preprotein translocase subunit YajC